MRQFCGVSRPEHSEVVASSVANVTLGRRQSVVRPVVPHAESSKTALMERRAEHMIPAERCWELLRGGWFARLGLSVDALPAIVPVEYSIAEGVIAACLGQYCLNTRSLDDSVVAFAADLVDSETHSGWAVQVQGWARLAQGALATECGQHEPGQIIYITPQTVVGRRLRLCPFGTGLPGVGSI